MADLLDQGSAWLEAQRQRFMTRSIVYQRSDQTVALQATIGRTEFEQVDEFGVVHKLQSRDFLVRAQDLVLNSELTLPKAGDRVRETVDDVTYVYEVMSPGAEPPWRYSDLYRQTLRIHTKHVARE
ncbi:MAG: hypothetical protein IPM64_10660 [Phycisphaerales bacterium]|nr:hypothetical protein [Phycisphaerales bacterium]